MHFFKVTSHAASVSYSSEKKTQFNTNSLVIFLFLLGTVMSKRGVSRHAPAAPPLILNQISEVNPYGFFLYSFETENKIHISELGYLKNPGAPNEAQSVEGSFSYIAPDGTPISVTYTADEDGFRAMGAHLPMAPEIPALIAKALAYNAAKSGVGEDEDDQTEPVSPPEFLYFDSPQDEGEFGFASGREI